MIGTDRSVRLLHPFPDLAWTELREAAVECARHGWPVLPGTYQVAEHAGWLGKRDAAGLEPVVEFWQLATTTDAATAMEKWTQRPYSVLLASAGVEDDHATVAAYFPSSTWTCRGEPCARQVLCTLSAGVWR